MLDRPVILTGFMGSGKSTVGRVLAKELGCPFIDLDEYISSEAGKTINEIFAESGEIAFRKMESICLEKVLNGDMAVIATGGGSVISVQNRILMRNRGYIVNLLAPISLIMKRLHKSNDRPLYAANITEDRLSRLMDERKLFYADADIRIDTDNKSVEDVASIIVNSLKELSA